MTSVQSTLKKTPRVDNFLHTGGVIECPVAYYSNPMKLVRTTEFEEALRLIRQAGPFTFITGRAGTGKSTLLKYFRETTELAAPVLAPTGVAALNVEGETIHRFFRFAPGITVKDARKKAAPYASRKYI